MKSNRILATVSLFALTTAAGITGARADNVTFDLTGIAPTLTAAAASSSVSTSTQIDSNADITATNSTALVGIPAGAGTHDVEGGLITGNVLLNDVFAEATGNDQGTLVDLYAATGSGVTSAATAASLQANTNTGTATLDATVTGAQVRADVEDIGTGSAITVDGNSLRADVAGNVSDSSVEGDINPALTSVELGQSTLSAAGMISGATALATNTQLNVDIATPTALLTDSRVALQAVVDGTPVSIDGASLSVSDNLARATLTGNDASSTVGIGNGEATTLTGSAGVSNYQANLFLDADADPFTAIVGDDPTTADPAFETVVIEIGDFANDAPIADLTGSSVDFTGNDILASVTGNAAGNAVSLADGINLAGSASATDQINAATSGGSSDVAADLFIQSLQSNAVDAQASVGSPDTDLSMLNVLTEDVFGSTITADGNSSGARATGNAVDNLIEVGDTAVFSGLVGINTLQFADANQNADMTGYMTVDLAGDLNGLGDSAGQVLASAVTVDGNAFYAEAIGNSQSSAFEITGTDVSGTGAQGAQSILSDRSNGTGGVAADFSIASVQVVNGQNVPGTAGADANLETSLDVNIAAQGGIAGSQFTNSSVTASGNEQRALAIGNLSSEAGITIDATTFTGTVGVSNDQTVQNDALLEATIDDVVDSMIEIHVEAETVTDASVAADGNTLSSRVWGNLADASTNAISISGVSVSDGDVAPLLLPSVAVDRTSDFVPITTVDGSFALLNDQSIEDLDEADTTVSIDIVDNIYVEIGGGTADTVIADVTATVNGNAAIASGVLNQATSAIDIDATSLDASSSLVNVQTVADEDDDGDAAYLHVELIDVDLEIHPEGGDAAIANTDLQINGNSLNSVARANIASNSVSVAAQTMTLSAVAAGGSEVSADLGDDTDARGEVTLVNDQFFESMEDLHALIEDSDIYIEANDIYEDGGLTASSWQIDGNATIATAVGNDAANAISLDVGAFDLSGANSAGGGLNGPVATLVSNQRSEDPNEDVEAEVQYLGNYIDVTDMDDGVTGSDLSVSGNQIRANSRSNTVVNQLSAAGTSFNDVVASTPTAELVDTGNGEIVLDQTSFAIASRQVNGFDTYSQLEDNYVGIDAYGIDVIEDSSLTVDSNLLVADARGNDAVNRAVMDFTTNGAQTFVANLQFSTDDDPVAEGQADGIQIVADANDDVGQEFINSSLSASGNAIAALASTNRADNGLTATGTNIVSGSGSAPSSTAEYDVGPDLSVTADFGIINVQGAEDLDDDADSGVYAIIWSDDDDTIIEADADVLISGSVTVDNNLMFAQGIDSAATNTLSLTASANVGVAGDTASATIVSQQILSDDNFVEVDLEDSSIGSIYYGIEDMSDAGSASVSVQGNQMIGEAIGGTVANTLRVSAGAEILGGAGTPTGSVSNGIDDPTTLAADFTILNVQMTAADDGGDADIDTEVDFNEIGIVVGSSLESDSLAVDNNTIAARASGLVSTNRLALEAASASDATAQIANLQRNSFDGSETDVEADAFALAILARVDGGMTDSSISVSGNDVLVTGLGNGALNALSTSAGATLQESSGAGAVLDAGDTTPITVTGADYSVLNFQLVADGGDVDAGIGGVVIGADDLSGASGIDNSAVDVNGNRAIASATGNDVTNALVLNTGTFQHPSSAIANVQTVSDSDVTSSTNTVAIGIGLGGGLIGGTSDNSSFRVRGNAIGASAVGNSAVNSLTSQ
jgi:hypothetical protein